MTFDQWWGDQDNGAPTKVFDSEHDLAKSAWNAAITANEPYAYEVLYVGPNPYGFPPKKLIYPHELCKYKASTDHQITCVLFKSSERKPE